MEEVKKKGIQTPAITVVGDVVGLSEVLDWYGKKPLSGKSVLVSLCIPSFICPLGEPIGL